MRVEPLGDSAYVLRDLPGPAHRVAEVLNGLQLPGLLEATASYGTVGVYVRPSFDPRALDGVLEGADLNAVSGSSHVIPVCFDFGEDLPYCADWLGLSFDELVDIFCSEALTCYAVGFCPGFPYLGRLPSRISGVPRLASPRLKVPSGSVAMTGDQAGVYPLDRPGGWRILGRTPVCMVDVEADYFPVRAGDQVRFRAIDRSDFERLRGQRI